MSHVIKSLGKGRNVHLSVIYISMAYWTKYFDCSKSQIVSKARMYALKICCLLHGIPVLNVCGLCLLILREKLIKFLASYYQAKQQGLSLSNKIKCTD